MELGIYPNPVTDQLVIDFSQPIKENGLIQIFDALGRNVSDLGIIKGQTKAIFNSSTLAKGEYTAIIHLSDGDSKKSFVKN